MVVHLLDGKPCFLGQEVNKEVCCRCHGFISKGEYRMRVARFVYRCFDCCRSLLFEERDTIPMVAMPKTGAL